MPIGFHPAELLVLAVPCGILICLVAGATALAVWLMRGTIRDEVRRALTEQRAQDRAGQG